MRTMQMGLHCSFQELSTNFDILSELYYWIEVSSAQLELTNERVSPVSGTTSMEHVLRACFFFFFLFSFFFFYSPFQSVHLQLLPYSNNCVICTS